MTFTDYTPQELIGMKVLYEYNNDVIPNRMIGTIRFVAKGLAYFQISQSKNKWVEDKKFDMTGKEKKKRGYSDNSKCTLITDEQALEYVKIWADRRKRNELRNEIIQKLKDGLPEMGLLEGIKNLMV